MVARVGIMGAMCSKDTIREEGIEEEKDGIMGEERIEDIEGTESDTEIMSDLGEGDGEIEIITKSTKIEEGRVDEVGSGEEMKGRDAGRTREDSGRDIVGSSAWP